MRVTVGDSCFCCCCVCATSFEPLCVGSFGFCLFDFLLLILFYFGGGEGGGGGFIFVLYFVFGQ